MSFNDTFTRGWISGACGGFLGGLSSFLSKYIGISSLRLSDWSAILIFGRVPPFNLIEQIYALLILSGSIGIVGIIFAYLLPLITDKNIYFKGWIIYLIPWWIIFLLTALAKTEGTLNLSVATSLSNGISISISGISAVYIYRVWSKKIAEKQ